MLIFRLTCLLLIKQNICLHHKHTEINRQTLFLYSSIEGFLVGAVCLIHSCTNFTGMGHVDGYNTVFKFYLPQVPVAMAVTFPFKTTRAQANFRQCRPSKVQGLLGMSKGNAHARIRSKWYWGWRDGSAIRTRFKSQHQHDS